MASTDIPKNETDNAAAEIEDVETAQELKPAARRVPQDEISEEQRKAEARIM